MLRPDFQQCAAAVLRRRPPYTVVENSKKGATC
ncbi:hypothetical protein V6Z11_A05G409500 [Gossypium hirsutum]